MFKYLMIVVISIFVVLLVINLFFRIKILRIYHRLVAGEVDFPPSYILNKEKLQNEIVPKYPLYEKEIMGLHKVLKTSLGVAFVVFIISLFIGYQYVKYR